MVRIPSLPALSPRIAALLIGGCTFIALTFAFQVWVHFCFEGYQYGPFLTSEYVGIPAKEANADIKVVCTREQVGWDGQYYYFVSNDPFMLRDDIHRGLDTPSYRYQRIGMPLIAFTVSRMFGCDLTPPMLYHLLQILIASIGVGLLSWYLITHAESRWYVLTWIGSGGVIHCLAHGVGDPVGDAFFAGACIAGLRGKLGWYTFAVTMAMLCRETYTVFAASVFVLTAFNVITWGERSLRERLILTALPGAILISWTSFVAFQLGEGFLAGARGAKSGVLVDLPFRAWWHEFKARWWGWDRVQLRYLLASAFTLVVVGFWVLRLARRVPFLACTLPLIVLTSATGSLMWEHWVGYLKNNGLVLIIGLMLLPYTKSWLLRFVLMLNLVMGMDLMLETRAWETPYFSPNITLPKLPASCESDEPDITSNENYRCSVSVLENDRSEGADYNGMWKWCHRAVRTYRVRITNDSTITWRPDPVPGDHPVRVGYRIYDKRNRIRSWGTVPLVEMVRPGESFECEIQFPLPISKGEYRMDVGVQQDMKAFDRGIDPFRIR